LFANTMLLKIFVCHYNSEAHNDLIPGLTTHAMNKIQVLESIFHKYPNKWTLDMKFFCQQSTIFLAFAQVFSVWNKNKVQQGYTSFRTKPLGQISYENYVLGNELLRYLGQKEDVPYFIQVVQDKHYNLVFQDIQDYKKKEAQIPLKYKMQTLQQLLPRPDYSLPDEVRRKIWSLANLPQ
jgi:hypothetical protein